MSKFKIGDKVRVISKTMGSVQISREDYKKLEIDNNKSVLYIDGNYCEIRACDAYYLLPLIQGYGFIKEIRHSGILYISESRDSLGLDKKHYYGEYCAIDIIKYEQEQLNLFE